MMFMTNLMNTHIQRYAPLLAFIKKCRKLPNVCVTSLRNVSEQEQESSPTEKVNDTFTLKKERRKIELNFRRRHSDFNGLYSFVNDDAVAAAIAEKVVESMKRKNEASVVEINPGMGKITQCLLQMGIKKVLLCDIKQFVLSRELFQQNNNILIYFYKNVFTNELQKIDYMMPPDLLQSKEKPLKIIIINCCRVLIRNMLKSIVFIDNNFLAESEFYTLLNEKIFRDSSENTSEIIDYGFIDVIFDVEVLGEFPREVVMPPTHEKYKKMYFVRLKRKKMPLVPFKNIKMYWNFINILMKKKNLYVLPCLEKWIPECGPLLIADGLLLSTKIRELTKSDLLKIFERLVSHGDFKCQVEMLNNEDLSLSKMS